ncbi:SAFB-like transcription modulator [Onthophagus taurus]|uniref:SAFB-like transcription modulator n=1 Tax=Onthophagus taurus TaxID=166361 RepID=UPI0039BDE394
MEVATSTTTMSDGVESVMTENEGAKNEADINGVEDDKEGVEEDGAGKVKEEDELIGEKEISSSAIPEQQSQNKEEKEEEPDVKKKNETPDVLCLQLDEGDNLDVYFEKEKARKKELEMSKMLKEEEKINHQEQNEKKSFEKKKKSIKITPKKVKSKIESVNKDKDQEKLEENLENQGDSKENADDNEIKQELNQQPEVTVKSTVVKCEKNKGDDKENKDNKENRFLWVSNINRYTKANDLKVHFTPHGKVQTARIVTDGKNYYGYLLMERKEDVENCIEKLQGTNFDGITIHLSEKKPEQKSKSTERKIDSRRKSTSSIKNDPLTLKVKDYKNEKETTLHKKRSDEEQRRKNREAERIREERRKERIKYEERKAQEMKIEREKRKLEHERRLIEEEKINLLRLQKRLAVTERSIIQRQKQDLERDIKNLEYKKRKTETTTYERKPKLTKIDEKYWKKDSSSKSYDENYKKVDSILVPPPPVLSENYHQKTNVGDKERNWKEISKESTLESRFSYDYERYQKDHRYKEKEKNYHWESGYNCGNNSANNNAWRGQEQRNVNRHSVSSFPVTTGNVYQVQSSTPSYYQGNRKSSNDYYYRGGDRKY